MSRTYVIVVLCTNKAGTALPSIYVQSIVVQYNSAFVSLIWACIESGCGAEIVLKAGWWMCTESPTEVARWNCSYISQQLLTDISQKLEKSNRNFANSYAKNYWVRTKAKCESFVNALLICVNTIQFTFIQITVKI